MKNGIELHWQLAPNPSGTALELRYRLRNTSQQPLLLGDTLLQEAAPPTYEVAANRMIVYSDAVDPTLVHLVRGRVAPPDGVMREVMPATRPFAPGEELSGAAKVALPLTGWHPNLGEYELTALPTRAVLELGIMPGTADTDMWPLANGDTIAVLDSTAGRTTHQLIQGAVVALPTPQ